MSGRLESFSPEQMVLLAPLVAIALSDGLTDDEIQVFAAFLASVADLMALIVAQDVLLPDSGQGT